MQSTQEYENHVKQSIIQFCDSLGLISAEISEIQVEQNEVETSESTGKEEIESKDTGIEQNSAPNSPEPQVKMVDTATFPPFPSPTMPNVIHRIRIPTPIFIEEKLSNLMTILEELKCEEEREIEREKRDLAEWRSKWQAITMDEEAVEVENAEESIESSESPTKVNESIKVESSKKDLKNLPSETIQSPDLEEFEHVHKQAEEEPLVKFDGDIPVENDDSPCVIVIEISKETLVSFVDTLRVALISFVEQESTTKQEVFTSFFLFFCC